MIKNILALQNNLLLKQDAYHKALLALRNATDEFLNARRESAMIPENGVENNGALWRAVFLIS
jgi:hypothetical protein